MPSLFRRHAEKRVRRLAVGTPDCTSNRGAGAGTRVVLYTVRLALNDVHDEGVGCVVFEGGSRAQLRQRIGFRCVARWKPVAPRSVESGWY